MIENKINEHNTYFSVLNNKLHLIQGQKIMIIIFFQTKLLKQQTHYRVVPGQEKRLWAFEVSLGTFCSVCNPDLVDSISYKTGYTC